MIREYFKKLSNQFYKTKPFHLLTNREEPNSYVIVKKYHYILLGSFILLLTSAQGQGKFKYPKTAFGAA